MYLECDLISLKHLITYYQKGLRTAFLAFTAIEPHATTFYGRFILFGLVLCRKPPIDRVYPRRLVACRTALHPVRSILHVRLSGDVRGQLNSVNPDEGMKDQ